ncbi:MAG: hypothetical protein ABR981_01465 [Candidatus Micrarchaeaceae archaeon]|jgi:hypothetical protein
MVETVKRTGKVFELGNPYLNEGGSCYFWPSGNRESNVALFRNKKDALGEHLVTMIREYNKSLETRMEEPHYPRLQLADESITIHIGNGGRWFGLGYDIGGGIMSMHNLDSYVDRILAFNVTSDCLEFLHKDMKAPKIIPEGNEIYKIEYPLPEGYSLLPMNSPFLLNRDLLKRICNVSKIGFLGIKEQKTKQEVLLDGAKVNIEDGICIGEGFKRWGVPRSTYLLAKLVDSCTFN